MHEDMMVFALAMVETVVLVAVFWRFGKWSTLSQPAKTNRTFLAAAFFALVALAPAVYIVYGLSVGEITYFRRSGPNAIYHRSQEAGLYWTTLALAYACFLFLFVSSIHLLVATVIRDKGPTNASTRRAKTHARDA